MVGIMISILPDMMGVDKMMDDDNGNVCPLPTQDEELNDENRQEAIDEYNYREPNTGASYKSNEVCGSCAMYNQTEEIMSCIEDDSGETGYCQSLKFVCMKENTCDMWAEGGPITSEMQEKYKDNL